jgi:type II secretion system protein I
MMATRKQGFAAFGFTLLEVMLALAILAMVAVTFLQNQVGNLRLVDESRQISLATLLIREKMAELESTGFPSVGANSGLGGEWFSPFRWETVVSSTELAVLRKAVVRVLWADGGRERNLELTAYFVRKDG